MCRLYLCGGPMADSSLLLSIQPYFVWRARARASRRRTATVPLLCGNCACALNCARVAFFRASATMPALTWG